MQMQQSGRLAGEFPHHSGHPVKAPADAQRRELFHLWTKTMGSGLPWRHHFTTEAVRI